MMDYDEANFAASLPEIYQYKFAMVFRPSEANRFSFWETVAVNRAINIKAFPDEASAIKWLKT
ncbi:hypothetical protein JXA32_11360 [Candidatus Sumerlaeota bacterium]|nr:hypothetical protein [Candidatus Sumerlaeota bacterium]